MENEKFIKPKIRIKRKFSNNEKTYFPGEVYHAISEMARRYVSRGDAEYVDKKEVITDAISNIRDFNHPKVSIVILVKDALYYVKKCLESLKTYTNNYELIIVDNASNEETKKYLNNIDWLDFKLITNKENKGFSYGNNQAIKIAKYDYICFLNSDTMLSPNWLGKLMRGFKLHKDVEIVGPSTCYCSTVQSLQVLKDINTQKINQKRINQIAEGLREDYREVAVVGFCWVIKKALFEKIGVYDYKRYGIATYEDIDLLWRASKAGFKSVWSMASYVHHFGNKTTIEMGLDPIKIRIGKKPIFDERIKDPNLFIENDVLIDDIKEIKAKQSKKIDVVIPVLDREKETIKTLEALFKNNKNINVIIVDNGSDDLGYLDEFKVKIIKNKENLGVIKAFNQGLSIAKSNYIVLMHNDIEMNTENWIKKAITFMEENSNVGIVGIAGWKKMEKNGVKGELITAIDRHNRKPNGDFKEVAITDGVCNVIRNIGLRFDEDYGYIHFYDLDLCMQYREIGYKIYVINGSATHFAEDREISTIQNEKYKKNIGNKKDRDYWKERRNIFIEKWKEFLPITI